MKIPPMNDVFPFSDSIAKLYGGWSEGKYFKRIFSAETLQSQILQINEFLLYHKFNFQLDYNIFEEDRMYHYNDFSFYKDLLGYNQIVLVYEQPCFIDPIVEATKFIDFFRENRDWKKFHTSKNLSMAIASEAGEILDIFLWDRDESIQKNKVEDEIADLLIYCFYLADNYKINILDAIVEKTIKNNLKYPIEKSKGSAKKYNEL